MERIYGYFSDVNQSIPEFEPGLSVKCPICHKRLSSPLITISLMVENDSRSYFYRTHTGCYDSLTPTQQQNVDGLIIDAAMLSQQAN